MNPLAGTPIGAALAKRPIDQRRGIPIPFVNETRDGGVDFAAVQADKVVACARQRLCGSCGTPLDYWIAFLGGPRCAEQRTYLDPAMHVDCALSSLTLCPHIRRQNHRRAPQHRIAGDVVTPDTMAEDKPAYWVMGICRDYETRIMAPGTDQTHVLFLPKPFKRLRTFGYDAHGHLTEMTAEQR